MMRILKFVLLGIPVCLMGWKFICERPLNYSSKIPFPESFRAQFPGGFSELIAKMSQYETTLTATIGAGYYTYMTFEAKKPESVEELCGSPYMPVDCKDILNPFTDKPLLETPPGTYGWFTISTSNTSDPFSPGHFHFLLPDEEDPNLKPIEVVNDNFLKLDSPPSLHGQQSAIFFLPKHLDDGWKTATAVQHSLAYVFSKYRICKKRMPTSFEELKEMFPFLSKLRNGFRKNYAQLAGFLTLPGNEYVFNISGLLFSPYPPPKATLRTSPWNQFTFTEEMLTGQPGDFYILIAQPGTAQHGNEFRIVVLGDDGRDIIFKFREERKKWEEQLARERPEVDHIHVFGW
ncbi:MAG: hypothetical protein V2G34_07265 [bacterium JZ-2024 1]